MPLICRDFISIPEHWNSPRHVLPIGTLINFAQWHFHVPACRLISTSVLFGTFEWNPRISPVTKYLRKIRSLLTPRAFLCSFLSEQVRQLEQEGITVPVIKKSDIMTLLSHKRYPAMLETTVQIQRLLHSARWFHYFRLITTPPIHGDRIGGTSSLHSLTWAEPMAYIAWHLVQQPQPETKQKINRLNSTLYPAWSVWLQ